MLAERTGQNNYSQLRYNLINLLNNICQIFRKMFHMKEQLCECWQSLWVGTIIQSSAPGAFPYHPILVRSNNSLLAPSGALNKTISHYIYGQPICQFSLSPCHSFRMVTKNCYHSARATHQCTKLMQLLQQTNKCNKMHTIQLKFQENQYFKVQSIFSTMLWLQMA